MLVVVVVAMAARLMMLMMMAAVVVARVNAAITATATTAVNDGVATASTDAAAAAAMVERCTAVWTQKRRKVSTGQRSAAIHRSVWLDVTAHVPVVAKVTTHRKTGPGTYKRRAFSSLTELSSF